MRPWPIAAFFGLLLTSQVHAGSIAPNSAPDCPLARQTYSSATPLGDLELNPRTKHVLDADFASTMTRFLAPFGGHPLPSGFANIVTPAAVVNMAGAEPTVLTKLDHDLAAIRPTLADARLRCARYDHVPPRLPRSIAHPAILVFDKITGFRDADSVNAARQTLRAMAARRGWTMVFSDNGAVFNRRDLARFDAVVWNNVSGDALTVPQETAFRRWIEAGGGFAGFHGSAGDPIYLWPWYADTLIGARFKGHPMTPQFQAAHVLVEDPANAITRGLAPGWTMTEEWYSFLPPPVDDRRHVLATLDESSYAPVGVGGENLRMGRHPIAWTRCIGKGRSFYSAIGHRPESYAEPHSLALLENGIAWAAGLGEMRCDDGREVRVR